MTKNSAARDGGSYNVSRAIDTITHIDCFKQSSCGRPSDSGTAVGMKTFIDELTISVQILRQCPKTLPRPSSSFFLRWLFWQDCSSSRITCGLTDCEFDLHPL